MNKYQPTYMIDSVAKIPLELLERDNIKGIILDVDNTLSPIGKGITAENYNWIKEAKKYNLKVCILSNTLNERKVKKIMLGLDVFGLHFANKPSVKGFEMARNMLDLPKENIIMIGDQIFTDILGANRYGIKSILVKPISRFEGMFTLIKRPFEKFVMRKMLKADKNND